MCFFFLSETFRKNYENAKAELLKAKAALNEAESTKLFDKKNSNARVKELEAKVGSLEDEVKICEERLSQANQRANKKEHEVPEIIWCL